MSLNLGDRLGSYEVLALIGEGGMGQVYRAHDTKLNRDVAIKVLLPAVASNAERLARFSREAQVLASLNHSNIAQIYGLEESDGVTGLVLELVEGPTLADVIAGHHSAEAESLRSRPRHGEVESARGLEMTFAFSIAKQIADALEAAHEQGVIHRDLKPANVKVRSDGTVKVLDFGLAKALDPTPSGPHNLANSPTLSMQATQAGVILGTAAYMSPEQAAGKPVDKRSDLWAFGVVLMEMLTGRPVFTGETVSHVVAAVLTKDPDWTALPTNTPPSLRKLLHRCLEKDRKRRFDSAANARLEIEDALTALAHETGGEAGASASGWRWRSAALVVISIVVTAALVSGVQLWLRPSAEPPPPLVRFSYVLPAGQTFSTGNLVFPVIAISRDGSQMAYASGGRVYLRGLAELEARAILGSEGAIAPTFSPDGRSIAFFQGGVVKRLPIEGGVAQTLCQTEYPTGMSWDASGILVGQHMGIVRCLASGGSPEPLVTVSPDEYASGPQMLPDGSAVMYALGRVADGAELWDKAQIVMERLPSHQRKTLLRGGSEPRYLAPRHLLYAVGGTIFDVAFNLAAQSVEGEPTPVLQGVNRAMATGTEFAAAQFAVSSTGTLVYVPGPAMGTSPARGLGLLDRKGQLTALNIPPAPYRRPRVSRDGRRLAVDSDDGKEAIVWIYELSGASARRRLTFAGKNRFPIWSPDGERVTFQSDRDGHSALFSQRADGTGEAERLTAPVQGETQVPDAWSPDGRSLLFTVERARAYSLWVWSSAEKKSTPFGGVHSVGPIEAVFSPNGRWIAYGSADGRPLPRSPNSGLYVQPFPATGARYQVPKQSIDFHPAWAPNGDELFYVPAMGNLSAVRVTGASALTFGSPLSLPPSLVQRSIDYEPREYDVLPDGRFVGLLAASGLDPADAPVSQIRVVVNWAEELKAKVPTK